MAANGKLKSIAPYIGAIITILIILNSFSAKWGATTEKVQANERQIKMMDRRIADEFTKAERRSEKRQDELKDDIKEFKDLMKDVIKEMRDD